MTSAPRDITRLLLAWNNGDEAALEELTPLVYAELHRLARRYMGRERSGHTLQTSALVTARSSSRARDKGYQYTLALTG